MGLEAELAKVLAREVAYRSATRTQGMTGYISRLAKSGKLTAIRANAVAIALYSLMSVIAAVPFLLGPYEPAGMNALFAVTSSTLLVFELVIALMQSAMFTSVFVSNSLVDPLLILPVSEEKILSAYFRAFLLYWGGLSTVFIVLPAMAIGGYVAACGALNPALPVIGAVLALAVLGFSYAAGIALGSYAHLAKKHSLLRGLSTLAWLVVFLGMYSGYYLARLAFKVSSTPLAYLVPFFGPLYAYASPAKLAVSSAITAATLAASAKLALRRMKVVVGTARPRPAPATPKRAPRRAPARLEIRVGSPLLEMARKDLKLVSREPRRLAQALIVALIPVVFAMPSLSGGASGFSKELMFVVTCMAGSMTGMMVDAVYFAEGEGARVLYMLPVTRCNIAISKALAALVLAAFLSLVVAAMCVVLVGDPLFAATMTILAAALSLSTSINNSALIAHFLPSTPSAWTEASMPRAAYTLVRLLLWGFVLAVSIAVLLVLAPLFGLYAAVGLAIAINAAIAAVILVACAGPRPL